MIKKVQERFALTHLGAVNLIKACVSCTISYLAIAMSIGVLYYFTCDVLEMLYGSSNTILYSMYLIEFVIVVILIFIVLTVFPALIFKVQFPTFFPTTVHCLFFLFVNETTFLPVMVNVAFLFVFTSFLSPTFMEILFTDTVSFFAALIGLPGICPKIDTTIVVPANTLHSHFFRTLFSSLFVSCLRFFS